MKSDVRDMTRILRQDAKSRDRVPETRNWSAAEPYG